MLSGKTKQFVVGLVLTSLISGQSIHARKLSIDNEVANGKLIRLDTSLNELQSNFNELQKKNEANKDYIADQEERYKNIEEIAQENASLKKENEEIKKQNELISKYQLNGNPTLSRGGSIIGKKVKLKKITVEISMYSREECGNNKTKSGKRPEWGMIAAPVEIPMGTKLIIPGDPILDKQVFTKEDTGGYIKKVGNTYRIDVFVETTAFAKEYGRKRNAEAYIIEVE